MADSETPRNGNGTVRLPWNVLMWLIGIVFLAGVAVSTWQERSYVDSRLTSVAEQYNNIMVQLVRIQTQVEMLQKEKVNGEAKRSPDDRRTSVGSAAN